jgi:hypothetical protein
VCKKQQNGRERGAGREIDWLTDDSFSSPIYDEKGLDFCIRNRIEYNNFVYFRGGWYLD